MRTSVTKMRLSDKHARSAGNIDVVLVAYDEYGKVYDFGALEIQAVYISGNIRNPFEHYMQNPARNFKMDWTGKENYPRPDYLSSSRKRLAPQLIFKGGILNTWGKKIAVALNKGFFETLPKLRRVKKGDADIAWMIYDLVPQKKSVIGATQQLKLVRHDVFYTKFDAALYQITRSKPGDIRDFMKELQEKVDEKLENPPTNEVLNSPFGN